MILRLATAAALLGPAAQDADPPAVPEAEAAPARTADEAPVQGPLEPTGWELLNQIEIVVNERIMTHLELIAYVQRGGQSETIEEFQRRFAEERLKRIETLLEDQAGRDIGFDADQVRRGVDRVEKNRIEALGGASAAGDEFKAQRYDATLMRGQIEEMLYASLWREYRQGLSPGPGGRISQDRFVRPGILRMVYEQDPERWGVGARVVLQQLVLSYPEDPDPADKEAVERRLVDLRERVLAGEDMGQLAEVFGNTKKGSYGMTPVLDESLLRRAYPELAPFLEAAEPGDVSDVLPYIEEERGEIGLLVVRLVSREAALGFTSYEVQERVRRRRLADLDAWRLDRGHWQLFQDAYVWPPPQGLERSSQRPGFEAPEAARPTPGP